MAMAFFSPFCLNSSLHHLQRKEFHCPQSNSRSRFCFQASGRIRTKPICLSIAKAEADVRKEDIVIVGAGIAGLVTAVSLHRLGVRSLVLEQADSLRTGGASLTLFKNGWQVLDATGVAGNLRSQFLEIQGMTVKSEDGRELRSFRFKDEDESQEIRDVERRILLETLANKLPPESVQVSSKLTKIETIANGETLLELENGNRLYAKIIIGCDGIRSSIARWMRFSEPNYVGHCAYMGLGFFPNGQPFEPKVNYIYGRGLRGGYVPVSPMKVYWFIWFNKSSPDGIIDELRYHNSELENVQCHEMYLYLVALHIAGPKIIDPVALKEQAKDLARNWPEELRNLIDLTPDDTIRKTPLVDRWLWPAVSPPASRGRVVLVGEAWHPMTPNLAQGACCALEDSIVLARKFAKAIQCENESVEEALRSYESERWPRVFLMTVRANLVGLLLQWENPVLCFVRNNIIIPKLVRLRPVLEHTNFDCEPLREAIQV